MSDRVRVELLADIECDGVTWAKGTRGQLVSIVTEDTWLVDFSSQGIGPGSRVEVPVGLCRIPVAISPS